MKTQHRGKAYFGMTVWASFTLVLVILGIGLRFRHAWALSISLEARTAIIWTTLLVPFVSFFWTAYYFARAKGQSAGLMLIGIFGPLTQLIAFAILISLPDKFSTPRKQKTKPEYSSQVERLIHYRIKAIPRIVFGLLGIIVAIYLTLCSRLWFADPENQKLAALLIFVAGYASVIFGCSYWATAKGWNDAIVFVALMPLAIFFLPGIKYIFIILPALLSISMAMMTLILVCVMAILPDNSGIQKRKIFDLKKKIKNEPAERRD